MVEEHPERVARAARNELLFRSVNEQILQMTERFRAQLSDIDIVCECAVASCVGTIRIPADSFTQIRREEGTFFVLPGHEDTDVEDVVDRRNEYFVVRKPVLVEER
jgi:hypothetical protein